MKRREFIKLSVVMGLALTDGFGNLLLNAEASEKTDLAVVQGSSPAKITRAAVDAIGGIKKFISKGDIVVVKPNMAWDRLPEQAANTNPEVVATVVKMCLEAGAKKVKVFDRAVNDPRRCYARAGLRMLQELQGLKLVTLTTGSSRMLTPKAAISKHGLFIQMSLKLTK